MPLDEVRQAHMLTLFSDYIAYSRRHRARRMQRVRSSLNRLYARDARLLIAACFSNAFVTVAIMVMFMISTTVATTDTLYHIWRHVSGVASIFFGVEWLGIMALMVNPRVHCFTIGFWVKTLCWPLDLVVYAMWLSGRISDDQPGFSLLCVRAFLLTQEIFKCVRHFVPTVSTSFKARAAVLVGNLAGLVVAFAALLFQVENRIFPQPESFTFVDSLYLVFIACTTVGFGDEAADSVLGRTLVVVAIVTLWMTFTVSIPRVMYLRQNQKISGATEVARLARTRRPIIIIADYVNDFGVIACMEEIIRHARLNEDFQTFAIFSHNAPSVLLKAYMRRLPLRYAAAHLRTSIADAEFWSSPIVQAAQVMVVPVMALPFGAAETHRLGGTLSAGGAGFSHMPDDPELIVSALTAQSVNPRLRICLETQHNHASASTMLPRANIPYVIPVTELRLQLLAAGACCDGVLAFAQNLLRGHTVGDLSRAVSGRDLRAVIEDDAGGGGGSDGAGDQWTVENTGTTNTIRGAIGMQMAATLAQRGLLLRPLTQGTRAAGDRAAAEAAAAFQDASTGPDSEDWLDFLYTTHTAYTTLLFYAAGLLVRHFRQPVGHVFENALFADLHTQMFTSAGVLIVGIEDEAGNIIVPPPPRLVIRAGAFVHVLARSASDAALVSAGVDLFAGSTAAVSPTSASGGNTPTTPAGGPLRHGLPAGRVSIPAYIDRNRRAQALQAVLTTPLISPLSRKPAGTGCTVAATQAPRSTPGAAVCPDSAAAAAAASANPVCIASSNVPDMRGVAPADVRARRILWLNGVMPGGPAGPGGYMPPAMALCSPYDSSYASGTGEEVVAVLNATPVPVMAPSIHIRPASAGSPAMIVPPATGSVPAAEARMGRGARGSIGRRSVDYQSDATALRELRRAGKSDRNVHASMTELFDIQPESSSSTVAAAAATTSATRLPAGSPRSLSILHASCTPELSSTPPLHAAFDHGRTRSFSGPPAQADAKMPIELAPADAFPTRQTGLATNAQLSTSSSTLPSSEASTQPDASADGDAQQKRSGAAAAPAATATRGILERISRPTTPVLQEELAAPFASAEQPDALLATAAAAAAALATSTPPRRRRVDEREPIPVLHAAALTAYGYEMVIGPGEKAALEACARRRGHAVIVGPAWAACSLLSAITELPLAGVFEACDDLIVLSRESPAQEALDRLSHLSAGFAMHTTVVVGSVVTAMDAVALNNAAIVMVLDNDRGAVEAADRAMMADADGSTVELSLSVAGDAPAITASRAAFGARDGVNGGPRVLSFLYSPYTLRFMHVPWSHAGHAYHHMIANESITSEADLSQFPRDSEDVSLDESAPIMQYSAKRLLRNALRVSAGAQIIWSPFDPLYASGRVLIHTVLSSLAGCMVHDATAGVFIRALVRAPFALVPVPPAFRGSTWGEFLPTAALGGIYPVAILRQYDPVLLSKELHDDECEIFSAGGISGRANRFCITMPPARLLLTASDAVLCLVAD